MERFFLSLILAVTSGTPPPDHHPAAQPAAPAATTSLLVEDAGGRLELFPTRRAALEAGSAGRGVAHRVVSASATAPIGPRGLGVLYNHTLGQQGYYTGEIAFGMQPGHGTPPDGAAVGDVAPGGAPGVYHISARTPAEFARLLGNLQARPDVAWVHPAVIYDPAPAAPAAAAAAG